MNARIRLDHDHLHHLLRQMVRIRHFEAKCVELYQAQKILGFLHLYDGEEAVSVGVMEALRAEDAIVATYREHGQAIARGVAMDRLMAEMLGKQEGCCRGRGGSMHIFDRATRFYGGNAIVGGGLPLAIGVALGDKMQGKKALTACFFGDGAVEEGEFHESMNLAEVWQLPVLFVCENNLYSMGMAVERAEPETNIARKAAAYRMPGVAVDGMDVVAVEAAAREAVERIRAAGGPQFLVCRTYRFRAIRCSIRRPSAARTRSRRGAARGRSRALRAGCARAASHARKTLPASRPRRMPRSMPPSPSPRPAPRSRSRSWSAS